MGWLFLLVGAVILTRRSYQHGREMGRLEAERDLAYGELEVLQADPQFDAKDLRLTPNDFQLPDPFYSECVTWNQRLLSTPLVKIIPFNCPETKQ